MTMNLLASLATINDVVRVALATGTVTWRGM